MCESDLPQGGHVNCVRFPTMPYVYREEEGVGGSLVSRTELLFASGIVMETRPLFIESLGCSHSPAVYHSHLMVEANAGQLKAASDFFFRLAAEQRRWMMDVVLVCSSTLTLPELSPLPFVFAGILPSYLLKTLHHTHTYCT